MCPPGTDQTTRTSQRWTLLSPCLQEKYDLTGDFTDRWNFSIPKFLESSTTWDAFDKLAHFDRDSDVARSILSALPISSYSGHSSSLERLPPEIINMILSSHYLDAKDILSLGLSSRILWVDVLEHVVLPRQKAPWAGKPLLCTGSYLMSVPAAIHTLKPDMAGQEKSFFARPGRGPIGAPSRGMCPARRFNWNAISTYIDRTEQSHSSIWLDSFTRASENSAVADGCLKVLARSLEAVLIPKKSSLPNAWMLRNQTTKEYISLKSGNLHGNKEHYVYVKGLPTLSLDKALMLRILWSASYTDKDTEEVNNAFGSNSQYSHGLTKLQRGSWAGHCFDVVPTSACADLGSDWTEVTSDIVAEAKKWTVRSK